MGRQCWKNPLGEYGWIKRASVGHPEYDLAERPDDRLRASAVVLGGRRFAANRVMRFEWSAAVKFFVLSSKNFKDSLILKIPNRK